MSAPVILNDGSMHLSFGRNCVNKFIRYSAPLFVKAMLARKKYIAPIFSRDLYARIELTNACNYRCSFCPHGSMKRKLGIMDNVLYRKIIDDCLASGIRKINLTSYGESLLDPDVLEKIRYAKETGADYVYLTTNGSLLDQEKSKAVIALGVDEVRVSIDAISADEYSEVRSEYNYDTVLKNISFLLQSKKADKSKTPIVTVCFIQRRDNEKDAKEFIKNWEEKADVIHLQAFHNWAARIEDKEPGSFVPCKRLWYTLNIFCNGRVWLCCADTEGQYILGDFRYNSLTEIWNGEKFQEARKRNLHNDKDFICSRCSLPMRDSMLWIKKMLTAKN